MIEIKKENKFKKLFKWFYTLETQKILDEWGKPLGGIMVLLEILKRVWFFMAILGILVIIYEILSLSILMI
jgi:hypothetical protein